MTGTVMGVLGPIPGAALGRTLVHEHLAIDMSAVRGDDDVRLDDGDVLADELRAAVRAGIGTIVDATTVDIGRRVDLLRAAATATGCHVIAATGLHHHGAYPTFVGTAGVEELADMFSADALVGIDGGPVRAGVIGELGTHGAEFDDLERKVFHAAALTQQRTGLPILTHTAEGALALEQVRQLTNHGADPGRVAIGHVDCASDAEAALAVARAGCFVGIDRCGIEWLRPDAARVETVRALCDAGFADRVLLSSDVARRSRLGAAGGYGYATVPLQFVGLLRAAGLDETTVERMLVDNPRRYLAGA